MHSTGARVPFALALVVQIGFIVHQIALLEPKIGRPDARFAVALTTSIVEFFLRRRIREIETPVPDYWRFRNAIDSAIKS
jgi:hypothetical protein